MRVNNCYSFTFFLLSFLMVCTYKADSVCNNSSNRLVLVSTLDGHFTALNTEKNGLVQWSIATDPGSMLCSNIHNLELIENSQFIRLIPSLNGGLYKFNGKHIQPVPVNADTLLSTSFRFSDDIVISGGKELQSYGLDVKTGQILYQCSMNKCSNFTKALDNYADIIILQRSTQVIRATDPYNGFERWNYSVSQHDVKLLPNTLNDCIITNQDTEFDIDIKVTVPDGVIFAYSKTDPNILLWQHQFNSPIANVWILDGHQLKWLDLFGASFTTNAMNGQNNPSPSLYIGTHDRQLYIQESAALENHILRSFGNFFSKSNCAPKLPRISFKAITGKRTDINSSSRKIPELTGESSPNTALTSALQSSEYNENAGHYLYGVELDDGEEAENDDNLTDGRPISNTAVYSVGSVVSLSHWWKEVLAMGTAALFLINFLCHDRIHSFIKNIVKTKKLKQERGKSVITDSGVVSIEISGHNNHNNSDNNGLLSENYNSRFFNDFEPVCILGKGGFGIVFEAKNRIDDCHYAIKRITLPSRTEARDRVMREVKALAKLEHHNIVRYFNAWQECPPSGWQEKQDELWSSKIREAKFIGSSVFYESSEQLSNRKKVKSDFDNENDTDSGFNFHIKRIAGAMTDRARENVDSSNSSFIVFGGVSNGTADEKNTAVGDTVALRTTNDREGVVLESDVIKNSNRSSIAVVAEKSPSRIYLYIQMQLCQQNSLREWLLDNHTRDKRDVLLIFEQIVQAVEYIHMQGLIHRDLKPSNIFFAPDGQIKVGDFGLVTEMIETEFSNACNTNTDNKCDHHTARVGTRLYMSPEQVNGAAYNYKVDIYSLGIIFFELLIPFSTEMERCTAITNARNGKFPNSFKTSFKPEYDLLTLMLSQFPEKRPTTYGIKSRLPLNPLLSDSHSGDDEWQFELPCKRTRSRSSNSFCLMMNAQNDDIADVN